MLVLRDKWARRVSILDLMLIRRRKGCSYKMETIIVETVDNLGVSWYCLDKL